MNIQKNYLAAINLYDSILSSGYASSEIFYNLVIVITRAMNRQMLFGIMKKL